MKTITRTAVLVIGLAVTSFGVSAASVQSTENQPAAVFDHHNSQHSLGPCGPYPCPKKPATQQGG